MTEFRARIGRIRTKGGADVRVLHAEPLSDNVISTLEEAIEQARKGELSSVAIAVVYRSGVTSCSWSKAASVSLLIGAVARLQARLQARLIRYLEE